ncbi:MAG: glycosyltransferase family 9 protein [Bacteroidota bacterium]
MKIISPKKIIISRTDSIGDVALTFPMCYWIKQNFPEVKLIYLGKEYTMPVIEGCSVIDKFISWDEIQQMPSSKKLIFFRGLQADTIIHVFPNKDIASLAKKAKITNRIGTSHRIFHFLTCNFRIDFSRKKSNLHEAQLNFELLRPLGLKNIPSWEDISENIAYWKVEKQELPKEIDEIVHSQKNIVILHPKSQGSAKEWPLENYMKLAEELVANESIVIFTGTVNEGKLFRSKIPTNPSILDTTGKLTLKQLIYLISKSSSLVACSTGPLHIAGLCGVQTIGLFSSKRPIHPGRWRPLGNLSKAIVYDSNCPICAKKKECSCIEKIAVETILAEIKKGA